MRRLLNFSLALIALVVSLPCFHSLCWRSSLVAGRFFTASSAWDGAEKVFYCYKFRTMRQDAEADTARLGLPTTIRELRRWEISADLAAR